MADQGKGKFFQVTVPDFSNGMSSYIRLGWAIDPKDDPGWDLAKIVPGFLDDERVRGGDYANDPVSARKDESKILHTKGGWRDHTEGNRISTTRGDKVEVIRGNYRRVVLGRQDDPTHGDHFDNSGGHPVDMAETPGQITNIKWVQTYGGTWKVVEATEKGDVDATYHGDVVEKYYGNILESYVGTDSPGSAVSFEGGVGSWQKDGPSTQKLNPAIVEKTWANSIKSYTGEGLPVPTIDEKTYAVKIDGYTEAQLITDKTKATMITSETEATGLIMDKTTAQMIVEETYGMVSSTYHGVKLEMNMDFTTTLSLSATNALTVGLSSDTFVGGQQEVFVGAKQSLNISAYQEITIAACTEIFIGSKTEISMGVRNECDMATKLEFGAAPQTEVTPKKTEVTVNINILAVGIFLG
jgi:hypothetical protein